MRVVLVLRKRRTNKSRPRAEDEALYDMRSLLKLLSDLSPQHRMQLGLAWLASLLLVAVVTWGLAALLLGGAEDAGIDEPSEVAQVGEEPGETSGVETSAEPPDSAVEAKPVPPRPKPSKPAASRTEPAPRSTSPKPKVPEPAPAPKPQASTAPTEASSVLLDRVLECARLYREGDEGAASRTEPAPRSTSPKPKAPEPAPAPKPQASTAPTEASSVLLDRVLECARLYREGDEEAARDGAEILLSEYSSASALSVAMIDEEVRNIRADLLALRILQIAGRDERSREVARQLRKAHGGTAEVAETIRLWKILRPHVVSVESGIGRNGEIVISGRVENPDITVVRRVKVLVEGLDAQRNVVRTVEVRVRPKLLGAEATGTFEAILKGSDLEGIKRTRASVSDFQFEVVNP